MNDVALGPAPSPDQEAKRRLRHMRRIATALMVHLSDKFALWQTISSRIFGQKLAQFLGF